MKILKIPESFCYCNCYILIKDDKCIVVDPGAGFSHIQKVIDDNKLKPAAIYLTHGHADHIGAALPLKEAYAVDIYAHEKERLSLTDRRLNLSGPFGGGGIEFEADHYVKGDGVVTDDEFQIRWISTPGHTPGSCCLLTERTLLTGDTLFQCSIGRMDLPMGNIQDMKASLEKLKKMDDDLKVLPGHGPDSTLGAEKKRNPFLTGGAYF